MFGVHYASVINSSNEVIGKPFLVTNNASVFSKLKDTLKDYNKEDVLIVIESTSIYGNNLIKYFYNLGFKITILNPILTNKLRKASIRNAKNDKIDSISIAQTALLCAYSLFKEEDYNNIELKELSRFRRNLKKSIASLKTKLTSCIDEAFPEYISFFNSGIHT
ncbi:IS110 family transposase, partial [Streptobacillus canis]|uniref:IS110 family transposase n=1 Tax=Streptobacillus canis TaxID=2678686 RepID=UPI0038B63792